MAKRSRRPTRRPAGRPGTRPTSTRPLPSVGPAPALAQRRDSAGLTEDEMRRAAELEAEIVAREQAAAATAAATDAQRTRARAIREASAYDPNVPLRIRAAHEYAYVARDVRRIGLTAALMVAILLGLYIAANVGIIKV